jgi:hypothetical protein
LVENVESGLSDFDVFFFGGVAMNREHNLGFVNDASSVDEADIKFSGEFVFDGHGVVRIACREWFNDVCLRFGEIRFCDQHLINLTFVDI